MRRAITNRINYFLDNWVPPRVRDSKVLMGMALRIALEHIKDLQLALEELRRICKKRLIIVVPRQREYKYTFDLHINFFPYEYTFQKLINNENAKILEIDHDWVCIENFYSTRL